MQKKNIDLLSLFFQMEEENGLFDLEEENILPVWDILRLHIYFKYYYPSEQLNKLFERPKREWLDYINLMVDFLNMPFYFFLKKGQNIFLTTSRGLNSNGQYFDKSAYALIAELGTNCFIVETNIKERTVYKTFNAFISLWKKFFKLNNLSETSFVKINEVLNEYFKESRITYEELNDIYRSVQSDYMYYRWLFKIKKTKKVYISRGNEKGAFLAAKNLGIPSFELQHAAFEFDNILYSYPNFISPKSNIVFPKFLLTFGEYWGKNMNVPVESISSIGNDFMSKNLNVRGDESILIISTIIHGKELLKLTLKLADSYPNLEFKYKLHINEYAMQGEYEELLSSKKNVRVIKNEEDINTLISKSQLVILIISTVLYEALNQNKKVAIYKKLNYSSQKNTFNLPNVYLFETPAEINPIINYENIKSDNLFFKPLDKVKVADLINN